MVTMYQLTREPIHGDPAARPGRAAHYIDTVPPEAPSVDPLMPFHVEPTPPTPHTFERLEPARRRLRLLCQHDSSWQHRRYR